MFECGFSFFRVACLSIFASMKFSSAVTNVFHILKPPCLESYGYRNDFDVNWNIDIFWSNIVVFLNKNLKIYITLQNYKSTKLCVWK